MAMHGTLVSLNVCAPVVAGLASEDAPPFFAPEDAGCPFAPEDAGYAVRV